MGGSVSCCRGHPSFDTGAKGKPSEGETPCLPEKPGPFSVSRTRVGVCGSVRIAVMAAHRLREPSQHMAAPDRTSEASFLSSPQEHTGAPTQATGGRYGSRHPGLRPLYLSRTRALPCTKCTEGVRIPARPVRVPPPRPAPLVSRARARCRVRNVRKVYGFRHLRHRVKFVREAPCVLRV